MDEDLDVAQARGGPTRGAQEGSAWWFPRRRHRRRV